MKTCSNCGSNGGFHVYKWTDIADPMARPSSPPDELNFCQECGIVYSPEEYKELEDVK